MNQYNKLIRWTSKTNKCPKGHVSFSSEEPSCRRSIRDQIRDQYRGSIPFHNTKKKNPVVCGSLHLGNSFCLFVFFFFCFCFLFVFFLVMTVMMTL